MFGRTLKPTTSAFDADGEHDVVAGDPADALVDDLDAHLRVLDLRELGDDRLDGADHVALDDEVQVLHLAELHLREERLERDAALRALRELLRAHTRRALAGDAAGDALGLDDAPVLARRRRLVEAKDLDRIARPAPP